MRGKLLRYKWVWIAALAVLIAIGMASLAFAYSVTANVAIQSIPGGAVYHVGDTIHYEVSAIGPTVTPGTGEDAISDATSTVDVHAHIAGGHDGDPGVFVLVADELEMKPNYIYTWTSTRFTVVDPSGPTTITDEPANIPGLDYVIQAGDLVELPSPNPPGRYQIRSTAHVGGDAMGEPGTIEYRTVEGDVFFDNVEASASAANSVIMPGTTTTISTDVDTIYSGDLVTWTVTESNDGTSTNAPLTDPYVNVDDADDDDDDGDMYVLTKVSSEYVSGDTDGDGVLDWGETWMWQFTSNPTDSQQLIATGHGLDALGLDVTYPYDMEERDDADVTVINPSTITSISATPTVIYSGDPVTWTVTEENDGDVDLTNPFVNLDDSSDDDDDGDIATLVAPPDSGDDGDGVLEVGETWMWSVVTNPTSDTQVIATGHGTDPLQTDITYPLDADERDDASVDVISPSTITSISATPTVVHAGDAVTWTVTEENDGDVDLTNPYVNLDDSSDDDDDGDIATLAAPPDSGDDGDGVLEVGETWMWAVVTNPTADTQVYATGHGTDPLGTDITYPLDADERDDASVDVINPSTITSIDVTPTAVYPGDAVTWTVMEENDGDVDLTNPYVNLDDSSDDDDDGDIATLVAPPDSGDDGDGVLEVGETWMWSVVTTLSVDTQVYATGHGTDPLGTDITFPLDQDERDDASVDVLNPSTITMISADSATVVSGDPVTWTVTEENDGDVDLTNPYVNIDDSSDDDDDGDVMTLVAPPDSGDDGDGVLEVGETWMWQFVTNPTMATTLYATGHGTDPLGTDITFPLDQDERDSATVEIREGMATRTPGFWKTHLDYTTHVFDVHLGGSMDLGWKQINSIDELMGVFYANNSRDSNGEKRDKLCQAKVIGSFHLASAILSDGLSNSAPVPDDPENPGMTIIESMRQALQGTDREEILRLAYLLDMYNNSGDDYEIEDGDGYMVEPADPKGSTIAADVSIMDCE